MDLFVDCGAPSLYNKWMRKNTNSGLRGVLCGATTADRKFDDFSFFNTDFHNEYRNAYCSFLLKNKHLINVYPNLDIPYNGEATWQNQKWFESKGLKPIPVIHFGNDLKWLELYIKKGHKYIAVGGLPRIPFSQLKTPLDEIWLKYIVDKKGYPKIKLHGFAVTSPRLLYRYPWFSCDSTSWVKLGLFGCITVPKMKYGKPDFKTFPMVIFVSKRASEEYRKNCKHIDSMSKYEKAIIEQYLKEKGFILGHSEILRKELDYKAKTNESIIKRLSDSVLIEAVYEKGVSNDNLIRDTFNAVYYKDLANSLPKWPWPVKFLHNKGLF